MKQQDLPQDSSPLQGISREVCYVKDGNGKYTSDLSTGWDVKKQALDNAWDDIKERTEETLLRVKNGELSSIAYFMELNVMDISLLASYTGFWKWTIKRHFQPNIFKQLNEKKLSIYAKAFNVNLQQLKTCNGNITSL